MSPTRKGGTDLDAPVINTKGATTAGTTFLVIGVIALLIGLGAWGLCFISTGIGIILLGIGQNKFRRYLWYGCFAAALVFFVIALWPVLH
jgi:hypothetical protein